MVHSQYTVSERFEIGHQSYDHGTTQLENSDRNWANTDGVQYDKNHVGYSGEGPSGMVSETGTTIVGLVAEDSVVLAADRRASAGGRMVTNKDVQKVDQVHPTAAIAMSGVVGHVQQLVRILRSESRLYADRRGEPLSMNALSTLTGHVLRTAPLGAVPLLGGVDENGAAVYELDGGGGVMSDTYAAGGSGMQFAYGVLEDQYEDGLTVSHAREIAAGAIAASSERDTASGNGLSIATITEEGVEIDAYDAPTEVV